MYGVPADLPLGRFVGKECSQIRLGRCDIHFVFSEAGEILVEGDWELSDPSRMTIDRAREHGARAFYRVHQIINSRVLRYEIHAPISFTL